MKNNLYIDALNSKSPFIIRDYLYDELSPILKENRPIIFVCIGTDRSTGDSLGPLVGEKLKVKVIDIDDHGKVKLSHKEFVEKVKKEQPAPQPEVKIEEAKSDSEEKPVEEKKKKGLFRRK